EAKNSTKQPKKTKITLRFQLQLFRVSFATHRSRITEKSQIPHKNLPSCRHKYYQRKIRRLFFLSAAHKYAQSPCVYWTIRVFHSPAAHSPNSSGFLNSRAEKRPTWAIAKKVFFNPLKMMVYFALFENSCKQALRPMNTGVL